MAIGYLQVNVFADNLGQPVKGANLEITGLNTNISTTTNSSGKTDDIELITPEKKYSLHPQSEVKPYSTYNIKATKEGLQETVIQGIQILPDETSIQNIVMHSIDEVNNSTKIVDIPDHTLWGRHSPKIPESSIKLDEENTRALIECRVPPFIVLHDGIPTNINASNYVVEFPEYIKNVVSNQIYPTWPKESIKAKILTTVSFTMNRIYTNWYPSRGYPFTITSSSAYDQKFVQGRNVFKTINSLVDELFLEYITMSSLKQPLLALQNDGVKVNNLRWFNKWSSKDLGERDFSSINILKSFYGGDITLKQSEIIFDTPNCIYEYNFELGSCDEGLAKIQNKLNLISGSYSDIPKILKSNGKFMQDTKKSVEAFQNIFNLPITGVVDFATYYKILYIHNAITKMLQGI
ncbi:MAG: peptidoglycan-binding protein [Clostridia bacterium]|nr:peptidoglycan-binding protein [Clostridia bacterium]MDD4376081.1 peptidoglycan-binding protein [Clostridia bacterium]